MQMGWKGLWAEGEGRAAMFASRRGMQQLYEAPRMGVPLPPAPLLCL